MKDSASFRNGERFVGNYLLYLLAAASERASAQFHARVRAMGLRVPEWRVLGCLVDGDGMILTELARLALMEQSRMTRVIDQMARRDLVERASDAADRRRVVIRLTQTGRTLAERLVAEARTHEAEVISALADTDAARLKPALQALLARLEEAAGQPSVKARVSGAPASSRPSSTEK